MSPIAAKRRVFWARGQQVQRPWNRSLLKKHKGGQHKGWNSVGKAGRGDEVRARGTELEGFEQRRDILTYCFLSVQFNDF